MKADLAIAQIFIGLLIAIAALIIGIFMCRRGVRTRDLKLRVKAYPIWIGGGCLTILLGSVDI
jgi:hypothetical protein